MGSSAILLVVVSVFDLIAFALAVAAEQRKNSVSQFLFGWVFGFFMGFVCLFVCHTKRQVCSYLPSSYMGIYYLEMF